jgi:hypothetical protein
VRETCRTGSEDQQAARGSSPAELGPSIGLCVLESETSTGTYLGSTAAGDVGLSHLYPEQTRLGEKKRYMPQSFLNENSGLCRVEFCRSRISGLFW